MKLHLGRHAYGLAAIAFGIIGLVWRNFNSWQQIDALGKIPHKEILACVVATVELVGGIIIQWQKTARYGVLILGTTYLIFALLWIPFIVDTPLIYDRWGNFFEQFSMVSGALIVYSTVGEMDSEKAVKAAGMGYIFFGICVISFTLEQLFYLKGTASFVPKWIPPSQMFWAITTTIAFAMAAATILSGRFALLASRLLTLMIICFGLLIWLPALFADPHMLINWAGNAENLGIAGAAWIAADFLSQIKITQLRWPFGRALVEQKKRIIL